jgi:hypothetical protein
VNPSSDPWAVWLHTDTGRVLVTFDDEYLAVKFAVRHSCQVIQIQIDF